MNKKDVIDFFDRCAATWDAEMIKSDEIIGRILDNAEVGPGMDILDVACGTGVMFDYYLSRGAASVTGIDISPEMAKVAAGKYESEPRVQVICADVEEAAFDRKFDVIVVYNAFPHFPEPRRLIKALAGLLKEGGRLTVAHGMSREAIDSHHKGTASKVSNGLMAAETLMKLFAPYVKVESMVSNSQMYQVCGTKRQDCTKEKADATLEELVALMQFTVDHNDAHAQELASFAQQLQDAGMGNAYRQLMDAVADFDVVNAKLDAVVNQLTDEIM